MPEEEHGGHAEAGGGGGGGGGGHGGHKGGHGGGGGHEEGHEGAPEWLISFADNVMLIMGFFVIMLAFFMKDANAVRGGVRDGQGDLAGNAEAGATTPEMLDWALAVRAAFNNPVDADSLNPRDQALVQRLRARSGLGPAADPGPKGRHLATQTLRPSEYYSLGGLLRFESGVGDLPPSAHDTVRDIAQYLTGFRSQIEVRGHVSLAEAHQLPHNGMALSYQRALAVAEALAAEGVDWMRLRLIACGAGEPVVAPAYDDAGQRSNQRVEVVVTDRAAFDAATSAPSSEPPVEDAAADETPAVER